MDIEITKYFNQIPGGFWNYFFQFCTTFGEAVLLIGVFGSIYLVFNKKLGEKLIYTMLFSMGINSVLKFTIQRKRPFQVESTGVQKKKYFLGDTATGPSFPSGHTQASSTLFFSLAKLLKKWYFWVISSILVVLVAMSRMYLGVHYFTDVLVGAFIGLGSVFFIDLLYERLSKHRIWYQIGYGVIITIILFFISGIDKSDYVQVLALYWSFVLGVWVENRFIQFSTDNLNWKTRILRLLVGLPIMAFVYLLGKFLLPDNLICYFIRYFFVGIAAFVGIPAMFKATHI